MPPRTASAVSNSVWTFATVLRSLPFQSQAPATSTNYSACLFSSSSYLEALKERPHKRKSQDPYREAQARQRKAANLARQKVLQASRQASLGDPVRSRPTPFIQSLQHPSRYSQTQTSTDGAEHLNFYLTPDSMSKQLAQSQWLTEPIPQSEISGTSTAASAEDDARARQWHATNHKNAERALESITSLDTGSSKDRTRLNIQRCIEEFGRHNTDKILPHRAASLRPTTAGPPPTLSESEAAAAAELAELPRRVGADTGSSEVQVAILTAKINVLVENLGKKDKNNKRNLRLLVHRRQKLLSYLRRKERGGPRWTNLVEKLGINDAMWKGEISM